MDVSYIVVTAALIAVFVCMFSIGVLFISRALKSFGGRRHSEIKPLLAVQRSYDRIRRVSRIPCGVVYISASDGEIGHPKKTGGTEAGYVHLEETLLASFDGKDDMVARQGGREYIVLTRMSESNLTSVVGQIRHDLALFCRSKKDVSPITVNFGAYLIPAGTIGFEESVARAKLACTEAKNSTRDYVAWDYDLQNDYDNRMEIGKNLRNGVGKNNFFLEFQPVIDISSGNIIGCEVLSRLNSNNNVLLPADFVPAVREGNLDREFDTFVFEKVCQWASVHNGVCRYLNYISVNFSRNTLSFAGVAEQLTALLQRYSVKPSLIALEVLEDKCDYDGDADNIAKNLKKLKSAGLCILLDDFGDGYSSFDDLKNFPVDAIKLSKSITAGMSSQIGRRIFKSLVNMAQNMNLKVVCEGAETLEQIELLKSAGVTYVQGYYFYKPVGPDRFEKAVINNRSKQKDVII